MKIEVVVHAYGEFYMRLLREQLRSLCRYNDSYFDVLVTVVCQDEDPLVLDVLPIRPSLIRPAIEILYLPRSCVLNRNVGRNWRALHTRADWVWFADADYLFGEGSLEAVAQLDPSVPLYFPRRVWKSQELWEGQPINFDSAMGAVIDGIWTQARLRKAIGGAQIVPGDVARKHGYLDGNRRYQRPAAGDVFLNTHGDRAFRASLGGPGTPADIPNVFRLRHRIPATSARHHLLPMEG